MIDGFFTAVFAEDTATLRAWSSGVSTLNYYYSVVVQAFRPARAADLKVRTTSTDSSDTCH